MEFLDNHFFVLKVNDRYWGYLSYKNSEGVYRDGEACTTSTFSDSDLIYRSEIREILNDIRRTNEQFFLRLTVMALDIDINEVEELPTIWLLGEYL